MSSAGRTTWTFCAFRGCRFACFPGLPVCPLHAQTIAAAVASWGGDTPSPQTLEERAAVQERVEAERAKGRDRWGQIYYVRLNDLIKIGWSSQLARRINDYTPGAQLLAHHPGRRRDETNLHRTFAYCRRHGREWYDGESRELNRHIEQMLAEWGAPVYTTQRTPPPAAEMPHARHRQATTAHLTK